MEYVGVREQFGRPVGSFQAVKHRLADLCVQVQAARSAACTPPGPSGPPPEQAPDVSVAAPLALAQGLEALRAASGQTASCTAASASQGSTTRTCTCVKRAASDALLFGPAHALRAHAAERAGLFATAATTTTTTTTTRGRAAA
ncbi:acyl-CoA dehydrogenase family protein [Actinacidiphila glaucinigra]|uniref:acyl-CoA dehydrogenase family protein n=1 Tax=Actinacidiphila glaucinigra TaxID=235986 RepID=UPI003682646D